MPTARSMLAWYRRLPLTVRLPAVVAVMIFAAAIGTTQVALHTVSRQFESQMANIGQVYLDGLSAALVPAFATGDAAAVTRVLELSLAVTEGVEDRRLAVLDARGQALAQVEREGLDDMPWPQEVLDVAQGARLADDDQSIWVWRTLDHSHRVLANLDVTAFSEEREQLRWGLVLLDLLVSVVCALLGFLVARQMQRPVALVTQHLQQGLAVPESLIQASDPESARLMRAVNRMADDAREREAMLALLSEQEREAVLGRLAATLAHEVRNPLGGMVTAVQTLRKFGDQPEARQDALEFIERGVLALRDVVDATLKTHRPGAGDRRLRLQDLQDVQRLVAGDAAQRGVEVAFEAAPGLPDELPLAATEVRQVLLNLLINAVRATGQGGRVRLSVKQQDQTLVLEVIDQGGGMAPDVARSLTRGEAHAGQGGLGVAVIVRLVRQLRGRVSVDAHSQGGTHITLHLPLDAKP
ncbi:sensor histidine kinase [Hydrogenophaga sp.]|uniref:sensor histidine kinase n=1 Tax=Hydrogenophaga sp. TaxID=1904254 RepID=UPI003F6EC13F